MKLNYATYRDKVNACWIGKNIGGTMGAPYEGTRDYLDIKGFITKKGEPLPNDDLDLQLIWLLALEHEGGKNITASVLGEYWLSYIVPHWNEYGIGKANMKRGLLPPLAGDYENSWNNSNGAWIRTEIWACSAPANPLAAAKYAVEDAKVDHGSGEGTYAAAFVAAMQAAAFVLNDVRKCIEIGLASISENSRVAKSVKLVLESYDKGISPKDTRNAIQEMNADLGDGWFEAPSNVAYAVLGLIYGEGDFKRSMIEAINCGDDTDCTGATVGATLGILNGMNGIPEDWKEHIGDRILTICLNKASSARGVPKTCTDLTERVVRVAPAVLFNNFDIGYDNKGMTDISITEGEADIPENIYESEIWMARRAKFEIGTIEKNLLEFVGPWFTVKISLPNGPEITPNGEVPFHLELTNKKHMHEDAPYSVSFRWWLPEGFTVDGKKSLMIPHWTNHSKILKVSSDYVIKASDTVNSRNRVVLEISCDARPNVVYCPIMLLG